MRLFDALSGRTGHFNSVAVPALNNIFARIKAYPDETARKLFTLSLIVSQRGIDPFFKPPQGPVIKDVKQYNKHDFEKLHAIFMIWILYDFCNMNLFTEEELRSGLGKILEINEQERNGYLHRLKHGSATPVGLNKLWAEIAEVIHTMPNTQENYLVFAREFSRICKETFQSL